MFEKKYQTQNSRQHKRLLAPYLMKYQILPAEALDSSLQESYLSNVKDLSAGGVKFWTERALAENTLLKIQISIPPIQRTLEMIAKAIRVRQVRGGSIFYIAAVFMEIPKSDQEALNQLAGKNNG